MLKKVDNNILKYLLLSAYFHQLCVLHSIYDVQVLYIYYDTMNVWTHSYILFSLIHTCIGHHAYRPYTQDMSAVKREKRCNTIVLANYGVSDKIDNFKNHSNWVRIFLAAHSISSLPTNKLGIRSLSLFS